MDLPKIDLGDQVLVRRRQLFLVKQGIKMDLLSMSGDGIFGPGTRHGTIEYQLKHGLNTTGTLDLGLFRVEGDKKSQSLDTVRLSGNFMQAKCIRKYGSSRRSGRAGFRNLRGSLTAWLKSRRGLFLSCL